MRKIRVKIELNYNYITLFYLKSRVIRQFDKNFNSVVAKTGGLL